MKVNFMTSFVESLYNKQEKIIGCAAGYNGMNDIGNANYREYLKSQNYSAEYIDNLIYRIENNIKD
jgi:hypothetical protein